MQPGSKLRATYIAVLAVVAIVGCAAVVAGIQSFGNRSDETGAVSGSVQVAGAESMRPVVTRCAEDFMSRNPQADIIVKGGGSGDGIAALLHGLVDIGMASRELSRRELDYVQSQGVSLAVHGLALNGISTVVNRAVSLGALELGQLRDIFAGKTHAAARRR
jgi:phosphate transport system substrate-binding protein